MLYGFSLLSDFFTYKSKILLLQPQNIEYHTYSRSHTTVDLLSDTAER